MRTLALLLLFLGPASLADALAAEPQVWRSVGPDGRVIFSDRPRPDATPVPLPTAPAATPAETQPDQPGTGGTEDGFLGSYDEFEIVQPEDGTTLRDADGQVPVSLLLAPALQSGHRLRLDVNNVPVEGELGSQTQLNLDGLPLGTHRLQAFVLDEAGVMVAATAVVHLHLRRPLPPGSLP